MVKIFLIALALTIAVNSLYTSSYWKNLGIDVTDGVFEEPTDSASIFLQTSCSDVDLSVPPYNHNGIVMSGYLSVSKAGSALAFLFYGKENITNKDRLKDYPTIIWLNGGPGSSSQLGNFMELGPHFVKPSTMSPYQIVKNDFTWIKEYNVLFVDQPVGTGLSYADPAYPNPYCKDMNEVATDFYNALK
jgi:carboxypeptidase C (cathepsin A)